MSRFRVIPFLFPVGALLGLGGTLFGAVAPPNAEISDEVVLLPPIIVSETAEEAVQWQYAAVPGYEVLTRSNATTTREFLRGAVEANQVLGALVPDDLRGHWSSPQVAVLTTPDQSVGAAREILRQYLDEDSGGVIRYVGRGGRGQVVRINVLSNVWLGERDFLGTYAEANPRFIQNEGIQLSSFAVREFLLARTPTLPDWFVAGVMEIYERSTREYSRLMVGPIVWESEEATEALEEDPDYPRTLLSMADFLKRPMPDPDDPIFPLWERQAALLVRWAVDERNEVKEPFWNFVRWVADGVPVEDAALSALHLTLADLRDRLSDYLPLAGTGVLNLSPERMPRVSVPSLRPATVAEVARIRGEIERLEVTFVGARHPEFRAPYIEQANRTLTIGWEAEVRDPEFMAVWGLFEVDIGNDDAARSYLEAATTGRVARTRPYLELARILLGEAMASREAADGRISFTQAAPILELLNAADEFQPKMEEVYLLAAAVLRARVSNAAAVDFSLLDSGLRAFPRNVPLHLQAALLKGAYGNADEAFYLIEWGLRLDLTPDQRVQFEEMRGALARQEP